MSLPKIGNLAPAFKLKNQNGEEVALKDFRGKNVVIYFYPKAMTPGCTTQACSIRDYKKEFNKLKTVVLGISPDSPERLKKFEARDELNFTLLSDEDHKVAEKYGAWGRKKFMGKEYDGILRQTYIVDKNGKLQEILTKFKTKDHHDVVLEYIKENL
ncbi:MAG: thioredoxin-dependent thiol peroxidase [Halobacteriovoraceae bacterium]|nr:thioredoxin-dependent thiol peroxidase [Halobacteriovoraceae bacterium]|tara:strand:+ start:12440 stop:12910 length:471 start_codon:yes stop_codon:yes gene_type:complete